jgi:hypothetical protein
MDLVRQQLYSNAIFLNMIIHDMRNPSSSIQFAVKELKNILKTHFEKLNVLKRILPRVQ